MKLNLGCGFHKLDGFINVDIYGEPDQVWDLEQTPWPWESDSVDEVVLRHVLEHLGKSSNEFLSIIKELYRVCRHGAVIHIEVPHPMHEHAYQDPTHVRFIDPGTFTLFSQRLNREAIAAGSAATPLGIYLNVDFELAGDPEFVLDPQWYAKLQNGEIDMDTLSHAMKHYRNVVCETRFKLQVIKSEAQEKA